MRRGKYLVKNITAIAISNFASKVIGFLLIPLYTRVLSTDEYGVYGLIATTLNVIIPVLTLNISDAVFRYAAIKNRPQGVLRIGLKFTIIGGLASVFLSCLLLLSGIIDVFGEYWIYLPLQFILSSCFSTINNYSLGNGKVTLVSIAGFLGTASVILTNLLFLIVFNMGLHGYFLASCISYLVQISILVMFGRILKDLRNESIDDGVNGEMVSYSKPLIWNRIGWWVNDSSDKYLVSYFCGLAANGVYNLSYKIPTILNTFQGVFSQAWGLSAIKEYDSEDKDFFYSKLYCIYNVMNVVLCAVLITANRPLAKILYANEFYEAWKYSPMLLIAAVFGGLSGFCGGILIAAKESRIYSISTVVGAITNIILNIVMITRWEIMGAAIATVISTMIVWLIRILYIRRLTNLSINPLLHIILYCFLMAQSIVDLIIDEMYGFAINCIITIIVMGISFLQVRPYIREVLINRKN